MKFKNIMLISLVLLCILMIGAVSAASDTGDIVEIDESNDQIIQANIDSDMEVSEESNLDNIILTENSAAGDSGADDKLTESSDSNSEVYGESNDNEIVGATGTFTNLDSLINGNSNPTVTLQNDYAYDSGDNLANGAIVIRRDLTIKGNGKTIDAKGSSGIFLIIENYRLTLENINIKNGIGIQGIGAGGAIFSQGGTLIVNNCNFTNNYASHSQAGGGVIYATGSSITVTGSNFYNNRASNSGGVIASMDGSSLTITGSNFYNNNACFGGTIFANNISSITITGSTFNNNSATQSGAIHFSSCNSISIENSNFKNNRASDHNTTGGAISAYRNSQFVLKNSNFTNNSVSAVEVGLGGAVYAQDSYLNLDRLNFYNNTISASSAAGGALVISNNKAYLSNSNFTNNNATNGGAVSVGHHGNLTANNNNYTYNRASFGGGALYVDDGAALNSKGDSMNYNTANDKGGAIYSLGNSCLNISSSFTQNNAKHGGAIYVCDANAFTVSGSSFTNNNAVGYGGAIYVNNSSLNVHGSTFSSNVAEIGGAISVLKDSSLNLIDGTFINNLANGVQGGGGALYIANGSSSTISGSNFTGNNANYVAGAIYANDLSSFTISKSTFRNNSASQHPVAVYADIGQISNTTFIDSNLSGGIPTSSDCQFLTTPSFKFESISTVTEGNPITISLTESNGFTGTVTVKIGTYSFSMDLTNGRGSKTITPNLPKGTYKAILNFTGNDNFLSGYAESNEFIIKLLSFCDLYDIINNAQSGAVITLDKDYTFIEEYDSGLTEGILINKNIVIKGNGHTLDMKGLARMFNIAEGAVVTIENINFVNGSSSSYGGAIIANGSTLNVRNSNFTNIMGNGIYIENSVSTVSDSIFKDNMANTGAAIRSYGSNLTVSNSAFANNLGRSGGAISLNGGSIAEIRNSNFTENGAEHGGAVYVYGGSRLNVQNSNFINGSASYDSAAIYANDASSSLYVSGSTFINNTASSSRLAIRAVNGEIRNSTFNESAIFGGISISEDCNIHYSPIFRFEQPMLNCFVGEPIHIWLREFHGFSGTLTLTVANESFDVTFVNGSASKDIVLNLPVGNYTAILNITNHKILGSYYLESNDFLIKIPSFKDLYELIRYSDEITLEHDYTYVEELDSEYINGITIDWDKVINGNGHTIDGSGLARIFNVSRGATLTLENLNLVNGSAHDGGAIYVEVGSTVNVIDSTLGHNTAEGSGGAIYSEGEVNVVNSTFDCNAAENGSGVHSEGSATIKNSTFVENDATGNVVEEGSKYCMPSVFEIAPISDFTSGSPITIAVNETHMINCTVTVTIGTESYDIPVENGLGTKIVTPNLAPGTYRAVLKFAGNELYYQYSVESNEFTVSKKADPIPNKTATAISASAVTTVYNGGKFLIVSLKDINGKALAGMEVTININGAKVYTTDKNGQVKVSTNGLAPKTYSAKLSFAGNDKFKASSAAVKVVVKKASPKLVAKKKTFKRKVKVKKYTVTLKTNQNKVMKKIKLTLKVKGKTYKATTNKKGVAVFKIKNLKKKGTYKATIKFAGNKYYNKITKKVKIVVKN